MRGKRLGRTPVAVAEDETKLASARRTPRRAKTGAVVTLLPRAEPSGAARRGPTGQDATVRHLPPEFWRAHPEAWPIYKPGPRNPLTPRGERPDFSVPESEKLTKAVLEGRLSGNDARAYGDAPRGALLTEVFGAGVSPDARLTLMQALWLDSAAEGEVHDGPAAILAQAVAAVLNALYFGGDEFGYSKDDIVQMTRTRLLAGQGRKLLADLMALNGCPNDG
jgi:hypothetical protein